MNDPLKAYEAAIARHGAGFEATLWGSPQTQALRFGVLADMLGRHRLMDASVLDVGCGDGAFVRWLREEGLGASVHGLDAMAPMIASAMEHGTRDATFDVCDVCATTEWCAAPSYDITLLSGTLNTMSDAQTMHVLDEAWHRCTVALAFNMLGNQPSPAWADKPLGPARRHDVDAITRWAAQNAVAVDVRDAYLDGHDVSIVAWRVAPQA
ncbi:MAG: methyltransferase domain-containing protein [Phycisphaerales bacterium]|nr:methyltransferase domain-containing protein [Phycisphaerales bacterium]